MPEAPSAVTITVLDQSGAVIPKAMVMVPDGEPETPYVQVPSAAQKRHETNQAGEAKFFLALGSHEISVSAIGFKERRGLVDVTDSSDQRVALILEVGPTSCGPCVTLQEYLPIIASEPLTESIAEQSVPSELVLRPTSWKKFRGRH
jgi:hypothetical protein